MHLCLNCGARFEFKSMLVQHCVLKGHQWVPHLPVCSKTVRIRRHSRWPFVLVLLGLLILGAGSWLATASAPLN